ncbi:MAG: hypothetical protein BGN86_15725 [Caulobacterales bacterium 68-7]|nr:MAG: hypothetical protein BGN86_15725 [Caulobacterales bacterium 68-7]
MALFVILAQDKPGGLDLRMSTRPEHVAFLEGLGASLKVAGPFLDAEGKPNGSLVIIEADDLAAAQAIAAADPYAKAGLFASAEVKPWRVGVGSLG